MRAGLFRGPRLAMVVGGLGLVVWVAGFEDALRLPFAVRFALVGAPVALLLVAAIGAELRERLGPSLFLAALLPAAHLFQGVARTAVAGALILVALAVGAWRVGEAERFPLCAGRERSWRHGLVAVALAVAVVYSVIGLRAEGHQRPDAAYYDGVARHIVTSGRLVEPLVWQFLTRPATVTHAAFDYWAPLTSLGLVPCLWGFGATERVALVAAALTSALSVLAFAWLAATTTAIRYGPIRLLAVLAFAFSPALASYRFDTESIAPFHLLLLLALYAFDRERFAAAVALAGLLPWCRTGEGFVFCFLLWAACAWRIVALPAARRPSRLRSAAIAAALAIAAYGAFNLALHGALLPPAARLGPFLSDPLDLLSWNADPHASVAAIAERLAPANLLDAARRTLDALAATKFTPLGPLWWAFAVISGIGLARRRIASATLWWLLLFAGAFLATVAAHRVYSERATLVLLPLVVLAGACGLDRVLARGHAWWAGRARSSAVAVAAACVLFALGHAARGDLSPYGERGPAWLGTASLADLTGTLDGRPVASELPYFVVAETGSPAVTLPLDGEAAVDDVLRRYDVGWLLLFGIDFASPDSPTETIVDEVLAGRRTKIGSFRLRPVRRRRGEWVLYRLEPA